MQAAHTSCGAIAHCLFQFTFFSLQKEFVENKTLFKKHQQAVVKIEKKQNEVSHKYESYHMTHMSYLGIHLGIHHF